MIDTNEVVLNVGFGWVCSTPDSNGPFLIGPFDNEEAAELWRRNLPSFAVEEVFIHGGSMVIFPDTYAEVSMKMKEARDKLRGGGEDQ